MGVFIFYTLIGILFNALRFTFLWFSINLLLFKKKKNIFKRNYALVYFILL